MSSNRSNHQLSDFDFRLPEKLIAQYPNSQRSNSRLLYLHNNKIQDCIFHDLPDILQPNDLLIINNTKVLKARLYGQKLTGAKVEILVERIAATNPYQALAQIRANRPCKPKTIITIENTINNAIDPIELKVINRINDLFQLQSPIPFAELMEQYGHIPLPPYVHRHADFRDIKRYQTIYAEQEGAIAAPTAGLHFDVALFSELKKRGIRIANITLHIGAGTFQPVRTEYLDEHIMHSEWCEVTEAVCQQIHATKSQGGRIVAVGTTSVRSLETAAADGILKSYTGETSLFIRPGYRFKVIDMLITNFHLPRSTLLMLVCAFGGKDAVLNAYRYAVMHNYRFFSYGDAMLLVK